MSVHGVFFEGFSNVEALKRQIFLKASYVNWTNLQSGIISSSISQVQSTRPLHL